MGDGYAFAQALRPGGIIGFGWYQNPKLVKAAFQWNASLLEKATDRLNPSGHVEGILLAMNADKMLLFAEIMLLLSLIGGLVALVSNRIRHRNPAPLGNRATREAKPKFELVINLKTAKALGGAERASVARRRDDRNEAVRVH